MVLVDISGVLGRRTLLGGAHSSWTWLTSLVFSVDGHFSVEPIRKGQGVPFHLSLPHFFQPSSPCDPLPIYLRFQSPPHVPARSPPFHIFLHLRPPSSSHFSLPSPLTSDPHISPCHATPRHATPRHATPRHATPRHATPRHATPRHALPSPLPTFIPPTPIHFTCPYSSLHFHFHLHPVLLPPLPSAFQIFLRPRSFPLPSTSFPYVSPSPSASLPHIPLSPSTSFPHILLPRPPPFHISLCPRPPHFHTFSFPVHLSSTHSSLPVHLPSTHSSLPLHLPSTHFYLPLDLPSTYSFVPVHPFRFSPPTSTSPSHIHPPPSTSPPHIPTYVSTPLFSIPSQTFRKQHNRICLIVFCNTSIYVKMSQCISFPLNVFFTKNRTKSCRILKDIIILKHNMHHIQVQR